MDDMMCDLPSVQILRLRQWLRFCFDFDQWPFVFKGYYCAALTTFPPSLKMYFTTTLSRVVLHSCLRSLQIRSLFFFLLSYFIARHILSFGYLAFFAISSNFLTFITADLLFAVIVNALAVFRRATSKDALTFNLEASGVAS